MNMTKYDHAKRFQKIAREEWHAAAQKEYKRKVLKTLKSLMEEADALNMLDIGNELNQAYIRIVNPDGYKPKVTYEEACRILDDLDRYVTQGI